MADQATIVKVSKKAMPLEKSLSDASNLSVENLNEEYAEGVAEKSVQANENEASAEEAPTEAIETKPDLEALIAEAEQRGYLRGRNESIEQLMQTPSGFESPIGVKTTDDTNGEPLILSNIRPSIWDR